MSCDLRIRPDRPHQPEAVEPGHHHVGQHEIGPARAHGGERLGARPERVDLEPALEETDQVVAHVGVVVGEHDAGQLGQAPSRRGGRRRVRGKPAHRFLDVGIRLPDLGAGLSVLHAVRLEMPESQRHANLELASLVEAAPGGDAPSVEAHQVADQREPDARPLVGPRTSAEHPVEALEEPGELVLGDAGTGVAHREHRLVPLHALPDGDLPLEGELQGVGEEIEDDPLPHVAVDVDRLAQVRSVDLELDARALEGRAEASREVPGVAREVGGAEDRVGPARLEPRELQQRIHQSLQAQRVAADELQLPAGVLGDRGRGAQLVQRPEQEGERGPELVADVVEEGGLGSVELGKRLGPSLLLLEGPGGLERRGQRSSDQLEERPV